MNKTEKTFLDRLSANPLFQFLSNNEALVQEALEQDTDPDDLTQIVAEDYFYLLKAVHKGPKPACVTLDPNDHYMLAADEILYDLDALIRHNDTVNTERKMEIDALMAEGVNICNVQKQLNHKINKDW